MNDQTESQTSGKARLLQIITTWHPNQEIAPMELEQLLTPVIGPAGQQVQSALPDFT